jgi:mRNA interferase MazF
VQRGEVWWVSGFSEKTAVVVLSAADEVRAMMIVDPADCDLNGVAVEVRVGTGEGLPCEGVVRVALPRPGHINCAWLVTARPTDLIERVGTLSSAKVRELDDALRVAGLE